MRLWHKDLVKYLPDKQLLGQWRECCAIAKSIWETGKTNHVLINKVNNYPIGDLVRYAGWVCRCLEDRGLYCNPVIFLRWVGNTYARSVEFGVGRRGDIEDIFPGWHTAEYLRQCYYNLEEKYDCGAIPEKSWQEIQQQIGGLVGSAE